MMPKYELTVEHNVICTKERICVCGQHYAMGIATLQNVKDKMIKGDPICWFRLRKPHQAMVGCVFKGDAGEAHQGCVCPMCGSDKWDMEITLEERRIVEI